MKRILKNIVIILILAFVASACEKDSETQFNDNNVEFCSYLNLDDIDKTIPIMNDYLSELKSDLSDEQKLQAFTKWLKSYSCVSDADILCVSCIKTLPEQSEISIMFIEERTVMVAVLDILMSNPLQAVRICSISIGRLVE